MEFSFHEKELDIQKLIFETSSKNYQLYYQDIRDKDGLEKIFQKHKVDGIVHLAALAGVRPSIERPLEYAEVNINATLNLWEFCKNFKIKKFVSASSSSVYGNNLKTPFSENHNVDQPISPYAATKKCGEILGHVYHQLYGIDVIHLRFFTVYGPRQRPDLAIHKFTKLISENKEIPIYGDGSTARDYTYIDDIIEGILKSILHLEAHHDLYEIINLGGSEVISLNEMVSTIEETLDKKARKSTLPMQEGDVEMTNANISKAKILLNYHPTTHFQYGIKKFVEWFLKNAS